MPQRPEDYQSTLNVGGNKRGGTDARTNDPFSYLKTKPEHAYLGHFKERGVLQDGHNTGARASRMRTAPGLGTPMTRREQVYAAGRTAAGGASLAGDRAAVRAARQSLRQARRGTVSDPMRPAARGGSAVELARASLQTAKATKRANVTARRQGRADFRRASRRGTYSA